MLNQKHWAALASLLLAGCLSGAEPRTLRLAISPAAQPASVAILECTPASGDVFTTIDIFYPHTFEIADYDLYIRLGEPEEGEDMVLPLATERIFAVLNNEIGVETLSPNQLSNVLLGLVKSWSEVSGPDLPVNIWIGPENDEARRIFEEEVLRGGNITGNARLAANPSALLDSVMNTSGGIGVLPAAWVDERVRSIDMSIDVPLLAVSTSELSSAARDLLACLQGSRGQAALAERYTPLD